MKKIQRYLMPIIVVALVLLVAGCSTDGNGVTSVDPGDISGGIGDLIGGFSGGIVEPECEGDECEVIEPECEGEECGDEGGAIAPLNLKTYRSKGFDPAKFGEEYDCRTKLVASGGVEPYTFSASATALPDGMTFNSDSKTVEGTPTKIGRFPMIFTVTDADGESETLEETIVVKDDYTIELRYARNEISEAIDELEDGVIPFDYRNLSAHIINGNGSAYEWSLKMNGRRGKKRISSDSKFITFVLPRANISENTEITVELSVLDESGHEVTRSYEVTRGKDPCTVPLEVTVNSAIDGIHGLGGAKFSARGGKGDYEFLATTDGTVTLYDLDGAEMEGNYSASFENVGTDAISINKIPTISGISGYKFDASVAVVDRECNLTATDTFSIEKKQKMDTLEDLRMICDFEDISEAGSSGGYKPYLEFEFHVKGRAVAKVHYNLSQCNHKEEKCETEFKIEAIEDGEDDEGNTRYFDLSEFELTDLDDVKLIKHKSTYFGPASDGDLDKLDVDLQWCRFYTENNKWFAVWDDQKNGDDLNEDEVSGNSHNTDNDSMREAFIMDRFEGWDGNNIDRIWFMGAMLENVGAASEDGFDYMTPRDNDCSDGDHNWCD